MLKKFSPAFFLFVFFLSHHLSAQVQVSGTILDEENQGLPGATVKVFNPDSVYITGAVTDIEGTYNVSLPANSKFNIQISYISYGGKAKTIPVQTFSEPITLKAVVLKEMAKNLAEVEVKTTQLRGEQKGDTTQFNAAAFKTNPDATAEDLVKKMPGITSDNSGIKVNGETVQKVLVDGKVFFGDDASAALKNLPADLIEKVEVFDKMSDQAAFTGFDDGDKQKTINLVTKKGKNVGQFGRIYGGAGSDEESNLKYSTGAAVHSFNNKQRLSLLLLSNNINQQNFSASDISGVASSSGQNQGGGGRGGSSNSLMASPQNGITTTTSAGLNYSDEWGKKINVSGSYFYNNSENYKEQNSVRNYFTDNNLVYKQTNSDRVLNQNHRVNFRFEYAIDSSNKITVVPNLNFQDNNSRSFLEGSNQVADNIRLSSTNTKQGIFNTGYDFSNMVMYQHKFTKPGRTISLRINNTINDRDNNGTYYSLNNYGDTSFTNLDQQFQTISTGNKIAGSLSYTEPLNKFAQVQLNYSPSYNVAASDKNTKDYDPLSAEYSRFNPALSNSYDNIYTTQRAGLSYRYRKEKLNFSLGADAQESALNGAQTYPIPFEIKQSFQNILPNARLNYKFSKTRNLNINYRSNTDIPNITQLQNVVDISNPLQVKAGNSNLKQTFDNNLNIRYGGFDSKTSKNIMLFVNGNYTGNYIGNSTTILNSDSVIQGYLVKAGSQLTKPVNLDNYYSGRAFFVYGFPGKVLKSNLNLNGGINYNHSPSLINEKLNYSNSYATNGGIYIGSNISEKIDFSLGYNANYTVVKNTEQKRSDNNFFSQSTSFKINWIFLKGFVFNTDVNYTLYNGLSQSFNQEYTLWNAYVGYKFLKDKSLEAKVSVFDILNQNRSISRTVTGAYTEDSYTTVLRRYAMFTLTYTLKNFKSGTPPKAEPAPDFQGGQRPPGMRPPGDQ